HPVPPGQQPGQAKPARRYSRDSLTSGKHERPVQGKGAAPVAEVAGVVEGEGYVAGVVAVVGSASGVIAVVGGVVRAAGAVPWLGELPHPSAPSAPSYSARDGAY